MICPDCGKAMLTERPHVHLDPLAAAGRHADLCLCPADGSDPDCNAPILAAAEAGERAVRVYRADLTAKARAAKPYWWLAEYGGEKGWDEAIEAVLRIIEDEP